MEHKAGKTFESDFEMIIHVSPDSNNGVFRRYHVGSNPVNFTDPLGLWKTKIHYSVTKALAISWGCGEDIAEEMASANKNVDIDPKTQPIQLSRENYRKYHYRRLIDGWKMAKDAKDVKSFGAALHTVQDYYSHMLSEDFPGQNYKDHLGRGYVDDPYLNRDAYNAMVLMTSRLIMEFCECRK